jgi:hypothetical protein
MFNQRPVPGGGKDEELDITNHTVGYIIPIRVKKRIIFSP